MLVRLFITWTAQFVAKYWKVKYKTGEKGIVAVRSLVDLSSYAGTERVKYLLLLPDKQSSHKPVTISLMTKWNRNFEEKVSNHAQGAVSIKS